MQAYLEFRLAWQIFNKAPESLSDPERQRLGQVARKQTGIEQRILKSPEAAGVMVPDSTRETRLVEIRRRYGNDEDYRQDLERVGLTEACLAQAVGRELHVEAVLEKVASAVPDASPVEAEIFYRLHPAAFERPEARRLRHILITFSSDREMAAARQTLTGLRRTALGAEAFAAAALRHSQCPTALQGGELGIVKRGQLHAELEPAAFALLEGDLSAVLESPVGLHILRCDQVFAACRMDFDQVRERIITKLTDQRRSQVQRNWMAALPA